MDHTQGELKPIVLTTPHFWSLQLPVTASNAPKHLTKDKTKAIPRYPVRENITASP
jgi:hypothetical protein